MDPHSLAFGIGYLWSLAVDAQGALHGCGNPQSTSSLNHLEIGASGNTAVGTRIMNGSEGHLCQVMLDSDGHVNIVYGSYRVYLRATLD